MNLLGMFPVAYLPLDDRPCNIDFPEWLAKAADLALLTTASSAEFKQAYMKASAGIVSYDRWIYGGLAESRESKLSAAQAKLKLAKLLNLLKKNDRRRYGFNVLLRQAPSAFNENEEKIAALIKEAARLEGKKFAQKALLDQLPPAAWKKYRLTRKRNLEINGKAVASAAKFGFDYFVIGLDDLTVNGLNHHERKILETLIRGSKAGDRIALLPGADELGMMLLARAALDKAQRYPSIFPIYSHSNPDQFTLRYEDCSITQLVRDQIRLLNLKMAKTEREADLLFFVHTPHENQLDVPEHAAPAEADEWIERLSAAIRGDKLSILADVRYANGADANLMRTLPSKLPVFSLAGFSGWNTAANASGMALAQGIVRWLAGDSTSHQKLLALRIYEDWFYQAEIRPGILARLRKEGRSAFRLSGDEEHQLASEIKNKIQRALQLYFKNDLNKFPDFGVSFPWRRLFDIRFALGSVPS